MLHTSISFLCVFVVVVVVVVMNQTRQPLGHCAAATRDLQMRANVKFWQGLECLFLVTRALSN